MKKYTGTKIACYIGYVSQAIVVNLAPLLFVTFQNKFGFSYSFIGSLVLFTFAVQIIVDLISIKLIPLMGYRTTAFLSQLLSVIGLCLMGISPMLFDNMKLMILVSVMIYSVGGGLTEVVISPIIQELPTDEEKTSSMSFLHSFYAWGQVAVIAFTTILLKLLGTDLWFVLPLLWALIPASGSVLFAKVPIGEPEYESLEKNPFRLLKKGTFIVALVLMVSAGAAEQIMAQWSSLYCEKGLGVTKVVGDLLGPCLFAGFLGLGRVLNGIFAPKLRLKNTLSATAFFSILCYLAAVFFKNPFLALAGCALCGFGVSIMWPGMLSLTAGIFPNGGSAMFSMLALGGDIGCSVGPYLTGIVSDRIGEASFFNKLVAVSGFEADRVCLNAGILAGIVFPLIMLVGTLLLKVPDKASDSKA